MSSGGLRHLPVILTILVALALSMVPLPGAAAPFRPDWVALTMIFWAISLPRSYSVGVAWIVGMRLMAVGAGCGDGRALVRGIARAAHDVVGIVARRAAQAGGVMHVGRHPHHDPNRSTPPDLESIPW